MIARTLDGDLDAYGQLVRQFEAMAYGYAYSVLGDFHSARDAAQDAFVEAFEKLSDLRSPTAFGAWLRRIVYKHCDRLLRRCRVPTVPLELVPEPTTECPAVPDAIARRELCQQALSLAKALPEDERLPITLFHLGGRSLKDIAAFLGIPVATVKNRLRSARHKLKEQMMKTLEDALLSHPLPERFADVIVQMTFVLSRVNPLAATMERLTPADLRDRTDALRKRLGDGEDRDAVRAEALAVVREASRRALAQPHYDIQLVGSMMLDQGWVAEIASGEGKSLVCLPAAYLAVLDGMHVHIATPNDYLARRDAGMAQRVFDLLGVTVDHLSGRKGEARRRAYSCDVVYGQCYAFQRDRVDDTETGAASQGSLDFAILDEIDSVLLDNAGTRISTPHPAPPDHAFYGDADRTARGLIRDAEAKPAYEAVSAQRTVRLSDDALPRVQGDLRGRVEQALRAHLLYEEGRDYVVQQERIVILDQSTGRLLAGSRWSDGLHQAVEAKEAVPTTAPPQLKSSLTTRDYYRLYRKLAGMTGTAQPQADEFREVYGVGVGVVPTRRDLNRVDCDDRVCANREAVIEAVVADVRHVSHDLRRPVLVRARNVREAAHVSEALTAAGIRHEVLDPSPDRAGREGEIVDAAGCLSPLREGSRRLVGNVTVATNMAGRGTDIRVERRACRKQCRVPSVRKLRSLGVTTDAPWTPGAVKCCMFCSEYDEETSCTHCFKPHLDPAFPARGRTECRSEVPCGLHVVGVGRQSARTDSQLRSRAARQGEPGSCRFYLSADDELAVEALRSLPGVDAPPAGKPSFVESPRLTRAIAAAQAARDDRDSAIRVELANLAAPGS